LQGFYLAIANKFPVDHARNLNRLLPLQVDARHEIRQKVIYRTSEEIIAGMLERGMSKDVVDAIVIALKPWAPTPIDYSKPRDLVAHPLPAAGDVKPDLQDHGVVVDADEGAGVDAIAAAAARRFSNDT
jgi:hypothetical protein